MSRHETQGGLSWRAFWLGVIGLVVPSACLFAQQQAGSGQVRVLLIPHQETTLAAQMSGSKNQVTGAGLCWGSGGSSGCRRARKNESRC